MFHFASGIDHSVTTSAAGSCCIALKMMGSGESKTYGKYNSHKHMTDWQQMTPLKAACL